MSNTKIKLLTIFQQLDRPIDMSTFDSRMIFQKEIYLLQELGVEISYSFGWYKRGPYSSSAASDGYQLTNLQIDPSSLPALSQSESDCVQNFQNLLSRAQERIPDQDEAFRLELLASLHFLMSHGYPSPKTDQEAVAMLTERKPRFRGYGEIALDILRESDLISDLDEV